MLDAPCTGSDTVVLFLGAELCNSWAMLLILHARHQGGIIILAGRPWLTAMLLRVTALPHSTLIRSPHAPVTLPLILFHSHPSTPNTTATSMSPGAQVEVQSFRHT
jgi:hypothetical protein